MLHKKGKNTCIRFSCWLDSLLFLLWFVREKVCAHDMLIVVKVKDAFLPVYPRACVCVRICMFVM